MTALIYLFIIVIAVGFWVLKKTDNSKQEKCDDKEDIKTEFDAKSIEYVKSHMQKRVKKTYYEVLGISSNACLSEIKTAYRELAKKYHPDHNSNKDSPHLFRKITEAYELLKDKNKRREYDNSLAKQYKKLLIIGGSVQNLRHCIARQIKTDSKNIKFTQTGRVFINDKLVNCWCTIDGFFVYYEPVLNTYESFDPSIHEIIILTAYTTVELRQMIALNFGYQIEDIELGESGVVLKNGENALYWRLTDNEYFEYYFPSEEDLT